METVVNFIIKTILQGIILTGVTGVLIFIFHEQFKAFIQFSTKYVFDTKLEDYKSKEIKRQKAILIADLISEWISFPENRKRLNQLTLEAFIWLPKDTAIKLSGLLSYSQDAPNVREIIAEVRNLILGEDEAIDTNSIIIFPPKNSKETTALQVDTEM